MDFTTSSGVTAKFSSFAIILERELSDLQLSLSPDHMLWEHLTGQEKPSHVEIMFEINLKEVCQSSEKVLRRI